MKKTVLMTSLALTSVMGLSTAMAHSNAPRFVNIDSAGQVNVSVLPSKNAYATYTKHSSHVLASIRNHTLFLKGNGKVTVNVKQLDNLSAYGNSTINTSRIVSKNLTVNAYNHSTVNVYGMISLKNVYATDSSMVNIKWLTNSNLSLNINSDSHVTLAGNVNFLRAKVSGNSVLNAEYCRANNVWVLAKAYAQAKLLPIDSLQSYARDNSNIYYYKTPKLLNTVNSQSGNTLQLDWRH